MRSQSGKPPIHGTTRRCVHGSSCTFAHGIAELQSQPDFYCSQLCMEFTQRGTCHYGAGCRFAHGSEKLRPAGYARALEGFHGGVTAMVLFAAPPQEDRGDVWVSQPAPSLGLAETQSQHDFRTNVP